MARKNTQRTFSIVASILSIITCCGLLSNAYGCNNVSVVAEDNRVGWHLVNDVNQLKNGDKITFLYEYNDSLRMISYFNKEKNRFDSVECSYSNDEINGEITTFDNNTNHFILTKTKDYYAFQTADGYAAGSYLTANSSTSNTCKLSNSITDESKFNITFNEDYALCVGLGEKTSNCIKAYTTFFSLYNINSGNFPYMYKWYGKDDPEIKLDLSYLNNYKSIINLDDYDVVFEEDLYLADGLEYIPVLVKDEQIYLPVLETNTEAWYQYTIEPFDILRNYYLSENYTFVSFTFKQHPEFNKAFNIYCNSRILQEEYQYYSDIIFMRTDNYENFYNHDQTSADVDSRFITCIYDDNSKKLLTDPDQSGYYLELGFYLGDDSFIHYGALQNFYQFGEESSPVTYYLVKK